MNIDMQHILIVIVGVTINSYWLIVFNEVTAIIFIPKKIKMKKVKHSKVPKFE